VRFTTKSFFINLPWGLGGVQVDVTEDIEKVAWALYVELNTRIATRPLERGEGSVREALTSLYRLFEITRSVLKEAGVGVAKFPEGQQSLASIAMEFLNTVVRPDLVRWHTSLAAHEAATWRRLVDGGKPLPNHPDLARALVDETAWEGYTSFHDELAVLQEKLGRYVVILGALAGATESRDVTAGPTKPERR
jgi:hypothetical protein